MNKERIRAKNLILILSSAVFIAFVAVVCLLYFFGSGPYVLRSTLVAPKVLDEVVQNEKIEFLYFNERENSWDHLLIDSSEYAAFYRLICSERSVPVVTDEMIDQFTERNPAVLTIFVLKDRASPPLNQQVELIKGSDIFRVKISGEDWAYFRFPGIYQHAISLFVR